MAAWCEPLLGEASVAPHGCAPGVQKVPVTAHVFERTCVGALQAHVALGLLQLRSRRCRRQHVQGLCIRLGFGSLAREPCRTRLPRAPPPLRAHARALCRLALCRLRPCRAALLRVDAAVARRLAPRELLADAGRACGVEGALVPFEQHPR
eukprot:scaffold50117_cov55-Phaeocystis_antarctica.AAC.1